MINPNPEGTKRREAWKARGTRLFIYRLTVTEIRNVTNPDHKSAAFFNAEEMMCCESAALGLIHEVGADKAAPSEPPRRERASKGRKSKRG